MLYRLRFVFHLPCFCNCVPPPPPKKTKTHTHHTHTHTRYTHSQIHTYTANIPWKTRRIHSRVLTLFILFILFVLSLLSRSIPHMQMLPTQDHLKSFLTSLLSVFPFINDEVSLTVTDLLCNRLDPESRKLLEWSK